MPRRSGAARPDSRTRIARPSFSCDRDDPRAVRTSMRFKRSSSQLVGSRLFSRRELNSGLDTDQAMDRGAFLGRLWGLFGKPSLRAGGFEYILRDTKTGLDFIAYVGRHGPCYGGELVQRTALRPVLEA